jgi:histidinol-phosphate aminotransferase
LPLRPKSHIVNLPAPVHGGINFAWSPGATANEILDFSTCCNPYRLPRQVFSAIRNADIQKYPDPRSSQLVEALSAKLNVSAGRIMIGSGSTELIRLAVTAYFGKQDTIIIPSPTYSEYGLACRIADTCVVKYPLTENEGFRLDCSSFISFAEAYKPKGIFLCNPNNPTGQYLRPADVGKIVKHFPDALVVLDEAYINFTDHPSNSVSLAKSGNLLIIRSMTKDFSLAGLRLGYAVSSEETIGVLKMVRPPWNVSSAAQVAGLAALSCDDYLSGCLVRIRDSRLYLTGQLENLGYKVIPTEANFFIFRAGDAAGFTRKMLEKGILVRDCASFGLPEYVRVAPRTRLECIKFIKAVRAIRGGTS